MTSELSKRSSRTPLLKPDDTTSLTSFPDPAESDSTPDLSSSGISPANEPLNGLLDGTGPSMFDDEDDSSGNPQTLSLASDETIERVIQYRGAVDLVRRLSRLLAERDAHVTALIRLAEEYKIPVEQIASVSTRAKQAEDRKIALATAAEDVSPSISRDRSRSPIVPDAASQNYATVRGLTRLFGGTSKRRESLQVPSTVKSPSSSRSTSVFATARGRPASMDVQSVASTESTNWATALFGGATKANGYAKTNGTVRRHDSRTSRAPVEMSTRHDPDQLPPTLQINARDPAEVEWNKYLLRLHKSREQAGEDARSGELIGASRFGTEGTAGKQKLEQLTRLVVSGIPMQLRHSIWIELSNTNAVMQPDAYNQYLNALDEDPREIDAILKDVPRTLTSKYDFYAEKGYDRLKRVLIAFVSKYPGLGYTQGLNMIAGYLLLAIPEESDAFWLLCNMVDEYFPPNYFSKEDAMSAPIADNVVLRQYVRELMPKLSEKMNELDVDAEHTVPLSWFLTAYASVLPETALLRIWDVWLCLPHGKTFLFNVALTLLAQHGKSLMECETQGEYFDYMSSRCKVPEDLEKINDFIRQAFTMRRKLEQVELRRALETTRLRKHPSTDALYAPEPELDPEA